jgi:hypothetical protein
MTYGLIPRVTSTSPFPEIHWDDLAHPTLDVVISRAVSRYGYASDTALDPTATGAFITIRRAYLQDYASLRGCSIIQVYYAQNKGPVSSETSALLGRRTVIAFEFPGRRVDVHLTAQSRENCLAAVWGSHQIITPGQLPIAEGREDYGTLLWPGIEKSMTAKSARATIEHAYVRDTVLGKYEARPEYTIIPEIGCVSYLEQWDTGNTTRVCRDIIQVELKKLYEGCPLEVVRHWHSHAVDPPKGDIDELASAANVATRAHRIAYSVAALGESLSSVLMQILKRNVPPEDIVGLSKQQMNYRGWWLEPTIGSVAHHIPLDMTRDQFLSRCAALDQFVVEAVQESHVRAIATWLDTSIEKDDSTKSIELLARILRMARVAIQSGLKFGRDSQQIITRISEQVAHTGLPCLGTLHSLRIAKSHRGTTKDVTRIRKALAFLQIDEKSTAPGWGHVLDALMDKLAEEIDCAALDLDRAINSR